LKKNPKALDEANRAVVTQNTGSGDLGKRMRSASLRWWKLRQSIEERASKEQMTSLLMIDQAER
jgi:hypothetical protein